MLSGIQYNHKSKKCVPYETVKMIEELFKEQLSTKTVESKQCFIPQTFEELLADKKEQIKNGTFKSAFTVFEEFLDIFYTDEYLKLNR